MAEGTRPVECQWCARPLPEYRGPGRPRKFCSHACRQRAREERVIWNGTSVRRLGERDGWTCYLCGMPIDGTRTSGWDAPCIDHVIPTSRGGQTAWDNVAVVHVRCNSLKGVDIVPHPSWGAA